MTAEPTNPARALCPTSQLRLSAKYLGAGNTEQTLGRIVLTNTGTGACTIQGYPGVSLLDASGTAVNRPAARVLNRNTAAFTIAPGESASTVVLDNVTSVTGEDCLSTSRSVTVKVYPPNQLVALLAPLAMNPCYLTVQPLEFGADAQLR